MAGQILRYSNAIMLAWPTSQPRSSLMALPSWSCRGCSGCLIHGVLVTLSWPLFTHMGPHHWDGRHALTLLPSYRLINSLLIRRQWRTMFYKILSYSKVQISGYRSQHLITQYTKTSPAVSQTGRKMPDTAKHWIKVQSGSWRAGRDSILRLQEQSVKKGVEEVQWFCCGDWITVHMI